MTTSCTKRPKAKTGTAAEKEAYIKRCRAGKRGAKTRKTGKKTGKTCGEPRMDGKKCKSRILMKSGKCISHGG